MSAKQHISMSQGTRHLIARPLGALIAPVGVGRLPAGKHACTRTVVVNHNCRRAICADWDQLRGFSSAIHRVLRAGMALPLANPASSTIRTSTVAFAAV